jgi:hypothetical protein
VNGVFNVIKQKSRIAKTEVSRILKDSYQQTFATGMTAFIQI